MSTTTITADPMQAYTLAVYHEVARIAGAARGGRDAFDIAGTVAVKVLESGGTIMSRYPYPEDYARACARNAGFSFDRSERVQRCEGVRLRVTVEGDKVLGRSWLPGDATIGDGSGSSWALVPDHGSEFETDTVSRLDALNQYRVYTHSIPANELREVLAVDGYEHSVADVAVVCGQRRETVSRRVNRVRDRIRLHGSAGCIAQLQST